MRRLVASLLLLSWMWALALAAMPEWHAWAHDLPHDACEEHGHHGEGEGDHTCAATLIATGAFSVAHAAPIRVAMPMIFAIVAWPWRSSDVVALVLVGKPLERGPPARVA